MATADETYKVALENRNALNSIKDKAKKTDEYPLVVADDNDLVRVTRGGVSSHTPVSDIRALSGAGEDNVQTDWDVIDGNDDRFLRNKPTALSDFDNDIGAGEGTSNDPNADTITGILTGGEVSINGGDNTKIDVAAGTGVVIDWTDPVNPKKTLVSWSQSIAVPIPNLSLGFSNVWVTSAGVILVASGILGSPEVRRSRIQLQAVVHENGINISAIGRSSRPAYEVIQSLMDYVTNLGAITKGNTCYNTSNDLSIAKLSGTTIFPFVNRSNSLQNPSILTMGAQNPIPNFIYTYQDGLGGFAINGVNSLLEPGQWDDGSGVLAVTPNNSYTVQRYYFIAATNTVIITYGQTVYASLTDAKNGIFTEVPSVSPILDLTEFLTAIVLKGNATDLSDLAQAEFLNISNGTTVTGGGGGVGDMTKAEYDTNANGIVDNSEALNGFTEADFVLEADKNVIYEMEIIKAPGNILQTLEIGDGRRGFWDATEYWRFAIYNGGTDTLKASHTIYDYFEI